jgi:hypothetical protein
MIRWQRRLAFTYAVRKIEIDVTEEQIYYRKLHKQQKLRGNK